MEERLQFNVAAPCPGVKESPPKRIWKVLTKDSEEPEARNCR